MTAAARISGDDMKRAKPFCPRTLAERWSCSPEKIRTMYRNGEIGGFQLGKLIRIPADEVERYECQNTPSPDTEESSPSPSESAVSCAESRLVRQSAGRQRLSPVSGGSGSGPIKIGISKTPMKRMRDLQTAHPFKLEMLCIVIGGGSLEKSYHKRFAEHRRHGEWFDPHPDILAEIDRLNTTPTSNGSPPRPGTDG